MSVFDFMISGGSASIGGNIDRAEMHKIDHDIRDFINNVNNISRGLNVPASVMLIKQASYLFVGKDIESYHILFAKSNDANMLKYFDLSSKGKVLLEKLIQEIRNTVGDVIWAFSIPIFGTVDEKKDIINTMSAQYVNSVLQAISKNNIQPSIESINNPDIATGLEKVREDFPIGSKIAFIIMKYGNTSIHEEVLKNIKDVLKDYGIIGLRADDKEYIEDLFQNIKVYMHICNFAIAVYDRILSDDFNPNVSLEVGYLLAMKKPVMILKDRTINTLNTDLMSKLYKEFNTTNSKETIKNAIEKWLNDKGFIRSV